LENAPLHKLVGTILPSYYVWHLKDMASPFYYGMPSKPPPWIYTVTEMNSGAQAQTIFWGMIPST
jgi:hypothetical protein